jgi:hypothetical protein
MDEDPKNIAERMVSMYGRSKYTPEERATDHAFSYDSTEPGRKFWIEVLDHINKLRKKA